jgi:hypothetical protein
LEDTDRPYDWDHILATDYCSRNASRGIWKYWGWTNANFRAWPQADNRGDRNDLPAKKLTGKDFEDTKRILDNSAIDLDDYNCWFEFKDVNSQEIYNILANYNLSKDNDIAGKIRDHILLNMTNRMVGIYKCWYNDLSLKDTFGAKNSDNE